jgi:hypothetical protein
VRCEKKMIYKMPATQPNQNVNDLGHSMPVCRNAAPRKVSIKGGKTLYLCVPSQPEYQMQYLRSDKFSIKIFNDYQLAFERDGTNISGCSFIQPNGTFKAKWKKN